MDSKRCCLVRRPRASKVDIYWFRPLKDHKFTTQNKTKVGESNLISSSQFSLDNSLQIWRKLVKHHEDPYDTIWRIKSFSQASPKFSQNANIFSQNVLIFRRLKTANDTLQMPYPVYEDSHFSKFSRAGLSWARRLENASSREGSARRRLTNVPKAKRQLLGAGLSHSSRGAK